MKANQFAAIKKLEAALLSCKRAGLTICGIDDNLFITVNDEAFANASLSQSGCEAMLQRANSGDTNTETVKHYGVYSDSGGA